MSKKTLNVINILVLLIVLVLILIVIKNEAFRLIEKRTDLKNLETIRLRFEEEVLPACPGNLHTVLNRKYCKDGFKKNGSIPECRKQCEAFPHCCKYQL